MDQSFSSGFFTAFAALYGAAGLYCLWSARRKHADPGTAELAALFLLLLVDSTIEGLHALSPASAFYVSVLRMPVDGLASAAMVAFAMARHDVPRRSLWPVFAGMGALGAAAAIEARDLSWNESASSRAAIVLGVAEAATVTYATAYIVQSYLRERRPGLVAVFGAGALCVSMIHDIPARLAGAQELAGFGYTAFTFAVFSGYVVRFTLRRDTLVEQTKELEKKSEALSRSFRELRAAQSELVRKEQLAAIGELSAVVAHEVRNPLAVITNAVSTLKRSGTSDENREVLLDILSEETARLNQLVGDLLHYAKPLSVERESVNVRDIVEKALAPLGSRPNVVSRILERAPIGRVRADPLLLRQAMENVVNNAVQAMPSGGTLTVELSALSRPSGRDSANGATTTGVQVVFRDTGEGMDTVVRSRALDPFFTTRPAGTGLGLAIVARVVDAHGGQLRILSEPEVGTEVRIFLPEEAAESAVVSRSRILPPVIERFSATREAK